MTSTDQGTAAPVQAKRASALSRFNAWVMHYSVYVVLWMSALFATIIVFSLAAEALPSVHRLESAQSLLNSGLLMILCAGAAFIWQRQDSPGQTFHKLQRKVAVLSGPVLGLRVSWRRFIGLLMLGLAIGLATYGLCYAIAQLPILQDSVPPTDARQESVAHAPEWAKILASPLRAAFPEELVYRGALLGVASLVTVTVKKRVVRTSVVVSVLLMISIAFGLSHLGWSLSNAVTATIGGLVFGVAALRTRSLWPGVFAHALFNALVYAF